ncbi:unnamed protein product [Durusdinium trenchii]
MLDQGMKILQTYTLATPTEVDEWALPRAVPTSGDSEGRNKRAPLEVVMSGCSSWACERAKPGLRHLRSTTIGSDIPKVPMLGCSIKPYLDCRRQSLNNRVKPEPSRLQGFIFFTLRTQFPAYSVPIHPRSRSSPLNGRVICVRFPPGDRCRTPRLRAPRWRR